MRRRHLKAFFLTYIDSLSATRIPLRDPRLRGRHNTRNSIHRCLNYYIQEIFQGFIDRREREWGLENFICIAKKSSIRFPKTPSRLRIQRGISTRLRNDNGIMIAMMEIVKARPHQRLWDDIRTQWNINVCKRLANLMIVGWSTRIHANQIMLS